MAVVVAAPMAASKAAASKAGRISMMKSRSDRPKVLIIGHGRHGKDTAGAILARLAGLSFVSSSQFACEKAVFPLVADLYEDAAACYNDRGAHRALWHHAIAAYNLRPGPCLAAQILAGHDVYVGMRRRAEFDATRALFDLVVWVDRSQVEPPEPADSNELSPADADLILDNNAGLGFLTAQIARLVSALDARV
jgi:hypothetical protein